MSSMVRDRLALVSFTALLLAFAVRLMVPTGWMPSPEGGFRIMPCVAAEATPKAHQHDHGKGHEKREQHDRATDCPFAPLLSGAALPEPPHAKFAGLEPHHVEMLGSALGSALPTGPPSPPPPSTGPPLLA